MFRSPSKLNVSLDSGVKRRLQRLAFDRQMSVSALISQWVRAEAGTEAAR